MNSVLYSEQANFELKNFQDAKQDFEKVLELDPTVKDAKRQTELCDKKIISSQSEERLLAQNMMSMIGKGGVGVQIVLCKISRPVIFKI